MLCFQQLIAHSDRGPPHRPPHRPPPLANPKRKKNNPPSSTNVVNAEDPNLPQPLTLARTAGEYGVLYVYLTATFLVFRPQRGQILEGWVNVQSEGFLGAIVLNLFSVGIERKRLPPSWKWIPPGEELEEEQQEQGQQASTTENEGDDSDSSNSETKKSAFDPAKELFRPIALAEDSVSGHRVRGTIKFRVVDVDVIPGSERESGFLSIEGSVTTMSGALAIRSASASVAPEPEVVDVHVEESPSKKKSSSSKEKKEKKEKKSKSSKKEKSKE
ncbi:Catenin-beta-like, Arm-motif containing nuclear family protein [Aspergillus niger]|uniref:DNA-directed RNA polymerase subunit n=1 Tax=Aspergillus niger TaxID=5061 RepID=A0A505I0V1_ASPNG|nr:Catenin-beta-like, Arm-motif containing nuclear family protein [Aspergillus niger]